MGWQVRPLAEIADCCLGKMLDKQKNRGEPRPYLRNVNVRWFEFDLSDLLEMPFETSERERYSVRKGDLVVCEGGYPGRCAIWEDDEPVFFQKALHRVRCHEPERAKWVQYFLWMSDADDSLRSHFTGSGIQHLTGQALARLKIPLPPLEEQRRIVAVLDDAFAAIATATANAEKNRANAREFFEALLRDLLFDTDGKMTSMGNVTDMKVGFAFKSHGYTADADGIRLIRGDNIVQGRFRWDDVKRWPRANAVEYADYRLEVGDVILAMDRTWVKAGLKFAVIGPDDVPSLLVQRVARLRANIATTNDYVSLQIASAPFTDYVLDIQTGLGVPHISGKQIADFRFVLPNRTKQDEIVRIAKEAKAACEGLVSAYDRKLLQLANLKQSLLHRAFSGELTSNPTAVVAVNDNFATPEFAAKIVAFAYERHVAENRVRNFGTVKAEKILHMV